jgi:uncharacterized C2H2 Zn-finger protein
MSVGALLKTTRPHSFLEETVSSAPAEGHNGLSTDQYLGLFSPLPGAGTPTAATTSQSVYTNQSIQVADHGIVAAELMSCGFDCEDRSIRSGPSSDNKTLDVPSLNPSPINNFSAFSERNESLSFTSTLNATDQGQHGAGADLFRLTDLQYLTRVPHSVLKEISNAVDKALTIAKTKTAQKSLEPRQDTQGQLLGGQQLQNITSGSKGVFRCEHPGCNRIFRHNKDRLRHVRQKHSEDAKTFICPVVDCPMGFKHEFHRTDKLRDHLSGERISSYQWTCVIPDCSKVAASRADLINHLGGHDALLRYRCYKVLRDYGFVPHSAYSSYFLANYICSIEGCPFGTGDEDCMSSHESIPHDGPFCTCPIPDCQVVHEDWSSVSDHLARAHDYITRQRFRESIVSQQHNPELATIMCPICPHEIIKAKLHEVRDHWQTHSPEQRLQGWEEILNTWVFAFGPNQSLMWWDSNGLFWKRNITLTGDMALAYLDLSDEELNKVTTNEEFMREGKRLRTCFELRKSGQQS